jgi:hypothetical protein
MRALAFTLTNALRHPTDADAAAAAAADDAGQLSPSLASRVLTHCISHDMFSEGVVTFVVWRIFQGQGSGGGLLKSSVISSVNKRRGAKDRATSFSEEDDGDRRETLRVLRCVAQRCPLVFDNCVQAAYKAVADGGVGGDDADAPASNGAAGAGDDVGDELQIGPTAAQIAAERAAKAACLRKLLADTFADTPYRLPGDNGLSLLLTLSHASPAMRVQAVETFASAVPLGCESTPDVVGIAQAASLCLTDDDAAVAAAAWAPPVLARVAAHLPHATLLECAHAAVG